MANEKPKKNEEVTVDFLELDHIRHKIREYVKKIKNVNHPYEYSNFYIGRGITRFAFYNVNLTYNSLRELVGEIRKEFWEYKTYLDGKTIQVYLRGDHREAK